ncbi:MAG: hypothetical protein KI786_04560 [Mameliella sp.]|nr:hypothetical protein [Phaeodactylibacter sp.]
MKNLITICLLFVAAISVTAQNNNAVPAQGYYPVNYQPAQQQGQYQQGAPQGAPAYGYYQPQRTVTLHSGTPIELETLFPLSSKNVQSGQTIDLRVKYDVIVKGHTLISAGAPAKAIISTAEKQKMFGKGGELQLMPQYVQTVDGQFLPVTGMAANYEGKDRKGWAIGGIAAGVLTGGVGFLALPFIKGKAVEVPAGTSINCSVLGKREIPVGQ